MLLTVECFTPNMSSRIPRSGPRLPILSSDDLESILEQWQDSEDRSDFSDDDDVETDPSYALEVNEQNLRQESDEEPKVPYPGEQDDNILITNSEANTSASAQPCKTAAAVPLPSTSSEIGTTPRSTCVPKTSIIRKTKNLELNEDQVRFRGSSKLPNETLESKTPYQAFSYLFTDDIVDLIRDETNLYNVHKDANKPINVTSQEIREFVGITYFMSIIHLPNVRMYWSEKYGYAHIRETMPLKRRIHDDTENTEKLLSSADFRLEIAETLVRYKKTNRLKRTSDVEALIQDKKKKGPCQHIPPKDDRLDQLGH
ncbi:unnamed protein product [Parnassius apollo]|uniref:(apollo) hypothetical protein n=1 Tax=Parnassius apollo TaxID=110799 RepID=A0A8S3XN55_PARAO|nr:unnamed protein product [Parnassius apollo]